MLCHSVYSDRRLRASCCLSAGWKCADWGSRLLGNVGHLKPIDVTSCTGKIDLFCVVLQSTGVWHFVAVCMFVCLHYRGSAIHRDVTWLDVWLTDSASRTLAQGLSTATVLTDAALRYHKTTLLGTGWTGHTNSSGAGSCWISRQTSRHSVTWCVNTTALNILWRAPCSVYWLSRRCCCLQTADRSAVCRHDTVWTSSGRTWESERERMCSWQQSQLISWAVTFI